MAKGYSWSIEFYSKGGFIKNVSVTANNREEAIKKVRDSGETIIEMICCRRTDRW